MTKRLMSMTLLIAACVLLAIVSNAMAQDANQPKETPKETPKVKDKNLVIGIVKTVKDNDGNIVEITVTAHKDLIYKVVLDEKGKELAAALGDKRARIEGYIETKGDVQWLTVDSFADIKPQADAKPKAKAKPKPAPKRPPKSK